MTRQGTSNIGLTYEDDKSKTFSYDNDIKNNMVMIDGEIGDAKNRLTDIENNTELAQFTPLLTQDSFVFSAGSGRDELGVEVDVSGNIVKGQVNDVVIKGNTRVALQDDTWSTDTSKWSNLGGATHSIVNNKYRITHTSSSAPNTPITLDTSKYYLITVEGTASTDTAQNVSLPGLKIYDTNTAATVKSSEMYLGTTGTKRLGSVLSPTDLSGLDSLVLVVRHVGNGYTEYGDFLIEEISSSDYAKELNQLMTERNYISSGVKSTVNTHIKSVGKNIFDFSKVVLVTPTEMYKTSSSIVMNPIATYRQANIWIPVKPSTSYILTASMSGGTNSPHIVFYGNATTKDVVPASYQGILNMADTELTVTTTSDAKYILLSCRNREITTSTFSNIQLEQNTTSTTYETYKESISYITLPEGEELRSLLNSVKDEVSGCKLYKRTNKVVLDGSESWSISGTLTNVYRFALLNAATNSVNYNHTDLFIVNNKKWSVVADYSLDSEHYFVENDNIHFFVSKSTIDTQSGSTTLEKFKNWLNATLVYQLATPKTININTTPLTCYPKGTIVIEPFMYKKVSYNNGITWNIPVSQIEEIKKVSTEEIITDYTLSNDGLSATINNASNGEEYIVKAPIRKEESTIPTTVMSYPTNMNAAIKSNADAINNLSKIVSEILVKL